MSRTSLAVVLLVLALVVGATLGHTLHGTAFAGGDLLAVLILAAALLVALTPERHHP